MSRVSGYTLGILPEEADVRWLANLPAAELAVALPANTLAYKRPARLVAMTLPTATTLRLSLAGEDLRLGYRRDLVFDLGGELTIDMAAAQVSAMATDDGLDIDIDIAGIPTGRNIVCRLTRSQPGYLLAACEDRLYTYRGYQLWDWAYGSRIEDLLDSTAGTLQAQAEVERTLAGIRGATAPQVSVTQPLPYRFAAHVRIGEQEVDVGLPS